MPEPIEVGVLGATGTVGREIVRRLVGHPWFRLAEVGASPRSRGRLADHLDAELPPALGDLPLRAEGPWRAPLLLSALPSRVAAKVEPELAARGHLVVSNASSHRMDPDVPLLVPDVNPDHLELLAHQASRWPGGLVTNPNCSVAGLAVALAPLDRAFGVERVHVTTLQAISGAGRPGPAAAELLDNVLPFIPGEEEKLEREPAKILGTLSGSGVTLASLTVSATATRVAVAHGHLLSVSVAFRTKQDVAAVVEAMRAFDGEATADLPGWRPPLAVLEAEDRPQPRVDRDLGDGMTVSVGRVRRCRVGHVKFVVLAHNLGRGAAGAAVLNAELCHARGWTRRLAERAAGDAPVAAGP